jgi:hypothetical protein
VVGVKTRRLNQGLGIHVSGDGPDSRNIVFCGEKKWTYFDVGGRVWCEIEDAPAFPPEAAEVE